MGLYLGQGVMHSWSLVKWSVTGMIGCTRGQRIVLIGPSKSQGEPCTHGVRRSDCWITLEGNVVLIL